MIAVLHRLQRNLYIICLDAQLLGVRGIGETQNVHGKAHRARAAHVEEPQWIGIGPRPAKGAVNRIMLEWMPVERSGTIIGNELLRILEGSAGGPSPRPRPARLSPRQAGWSQSRIG